MIGEIIGGTLGAAQMGIGLYKNAHNKRPTYEIPKEISDNLGQANQQSLQGMSQESKNYAETQSNRNAAYALSQSNSRKGGLAGLGAINQNQNDFASQMATQDAAVRAQNMDKLAGARQTMADYKDQAFKFNKVDPYQEKQAQANALIGAGTQNISGGLMSAGSDLFGQGKKQQYGAYGNGSNYDSNIMV